MRKLVIIFLAATFVNAGRTSEWSAPFALREQVNAVQQSPALFTAQKQLVVMVAQERETVTFTLGGIPGATSCALRIYGINGRSVQDLSGMVHSGSASVVWKTGALSRGVFLVRLSSGNKSKTVRFVLYK